MDIRKVEEQNTSTNESEDVDMDLVFAKILAKAILEVEDTSMEKRGQG